MQMSDHSNHIVPMPGCEECSQSVTTADVKRWIVERLAAASINADDMPDLRIERDPADPSMVNVTFVPRPADKFSVHCGVVTTRRR
jgi:hypothetical protein